MAKPVKSPTTSLAAVEKLFGPVLPGLDTPERTISVFQDYLSAKKYSLYGKLGILPGALWHLHTVLPINTAQVKERITGIIEEGPQHNSGRREFVARWWEEFEAKRIEEPKSKKAVAKKAGQDSKPSAKVPKEAAPLKTEEASSQKTRQSGEYDAELRIGALGTAIKVRVKVDAQGKVTLFGPLFVKNSDI